MRGTLGYISLLDPSPVKELIKGFGSGVLCSGFRQPQNDKGALVAG